MALKRIHLIAGSVAVTVASLMLASTAFADPSAAELRAQSSELKDELAGIQLQLEKASDDYYRVLSEKEAADAAVQQAKDDIAAADAKIGDLQHKMGVRVKDMYMKNDLTSMISLLLDLDSFDEALSAFTYLDNMNRTDAAMVEETKRLRSEIEQREEAAAEQSPVAAAKAEEARAIKDEAQAQVDEYESKIADLDAQARQQAMAEAARSAAATASSRTSYSTSSADGIPTHGDVVDYAYSRLGCPYVWAGSGPSYFDCSGLVMWCYAQTGVSLPHSTESMYGCAKAVIPVSEAQPGDVLYMYGHVGLCVEPGGGTYIHAPHSGDVVRVATWPMFSCALRF